MRRYNILNGLEIPTYTQDIQKFFRFKDINSMRPRGVELGSYEGLKANANKIYKAVSTKHMPCDGPWDDYKIMIFKRWIDVGMPR